MKLVFWIVTYKNWNKLGHWYTGQMVIDLFSVFCLTMIKTMIPPENEKLDCPIDITWKVLWGHRSPLLFSKQYIVIILQYDCRDTLISDTGLAWESSSKQSSTYCCEIVIWHISAYFQGPCTVARNGKHIVRLNLSSLSVIFCTL